MTELQVEEELMNAGYHSTDSSRYTVPRNAPPRVRRVTVAVRGLHYEHSPIGLAHQLHGSAGIVDVAVDPRAGTVSIAYDASLLSKDSVIHLISECGYELGHGDLVAAEADAMQGVRP